MTAKYCMVMPVITVSLYTGRTQREKDRLAEAITEDVVKILNVAKKDEVIIFQEASHGIGMLQEYGFKNNGQRGIVTKPFKQQFHSLPGWCFIFP
jgi:4-oxalocrotonate tautomerase